MNSNYRIQIICEFGKLFDLLFNDTWLIFIFYANDHKKDICGSLFHIGCFGGSYCANSPLHDSSCIDRRPIVLGGENHCEVRSHFLWLQSIEHIDNNWDKQTYILFKDGLKTMFSYGKLKSQSTVPDYIFTTTISSDSQVTCFGAAVIVPNSLAIVDCVRSNNTNGSVTLHNQFHYV